MTAFTLALAAALTPPSKSRAQARELPPRLVRTVEAAYPPEPLRHGEGATVVLLLELDAAGRVRSVRVAVPSARAAFDEAAVAAVREFEFDPARRDGRAVPALLRYRYVFRPPARPLDEDAPPASAAPQPSRARAVAATPRATATPAPDEQGVTVYGRAASRELGRREVTAEEIRRVPGARGDALLALQALPGIARPPFGLGQFVVRSSAPEETLVLLESQPIGTPFHFYGLASTIATDLIERIEYVPGNFSARYGRVSGGVVNVTLRAPERDRVHVAADVDLIDAGAYGSVPLGRRASLAVGARASYLQLFAPLVFGAGNGVSFRQWPAYGDYQAALDWDPTDRDTIRVIAAGSEDAFISDVSVPDANDPSVRGTVGTSVRYHGVQARWRHRIAPGVAHTFAPALAYNATAGSVGDAAGFDFRALTFTLRDELEARLSSRARFFAGLDAALGGSDNSVRAPPVATNGITDPLTPATLVRYADRRTFVNPAAYAELELDATDALRVRAGARLDHYRVLASEALVDPGRYAATTLDPRVAARLALAQNVALRAGFGAYSSPARGYYVLPGFGNPTLAPERWLHGTVAAEWQPLPGMLELELAGFVKLGDRVIAPTSAPRVDDSGRAVPARFSNDGRGRVYGAEVLVRLRPGARAPVYALVSYTLQRAERAACAACAWGVYSYDQPHIFSAVVGTLLPAGWEVGGRVRVTSGIVEPVVTGALYDADHDVAVTLTDPLATGRLPPFFALDVRAAKRFTLGPVRGQVILEVLNATNYGNAESRIYSYDRRDSRLVYGLPILPNLGVRAEY